ncbi:MAG: apolipoprotein N-acyltransferase [bacterium]
MKKYSLYILSIISGIIIALPLSYPGLYLLSWVGLVPFLYGIKKVSDFNYFTYFKAGSIFGFTIIFSSSFWLYYPLVEHSGLPWLFAVFLFLLLFILFGFIYGIWACLFVYVKKPGKISPFWLAISWVSIEYLRFRFLSELPFGFIAYTQSNFTSLLQFAEFGGIYIISFIVLLINGYIFKFVINKKFRYIVPVLLILIIILSVGMLRLNYIKGLEQETVNVGVVQSNLTPAEKWDIANIEKNMDYFIDQSREISDYSLVVWPESSLTFDFVRNGFYREKFNKKISNIDFYLQTGSLAVAGEGVQKYNSSFLIGPDGEVVDRYNKNRLVPFGEYIPFTSLVEKLTGLRYYSELPGEEVRIFQMNNVKWKTLICSEILYPDIAKEKINSAQFLVNQSNEAWYRMGNLQEQMWSAALFRAVENRRSIVKSGNKAYGGVISTGGTDVIKNHSINVTTFTGELAVSNINTLYQKWGNYIGYISLIIVLILLITRVLLSLMKKLGLITFK